MFRKHPALGISIIGCCLVGLALGLAVACTVPVTPTPEQVGLLYTRTPTPTAIPATPTPPPQVLYQQGLSRREAWDLEVALERYDAALAAANETLGPSTAPIYASRAELHRLAGRHPEAAADIATALSLDPELAEAWRQKTLLNRSQGDWDAALEAANKLIELEPTSGAGYALRAQIYREAFDEPQRALEDLNRAIDLEPALKEATVIERWQILADLARWQEALLVSYEMFTSDERYPLRYFYRGWPLVQMGRIDNAIQVLWRGLQRHPDEPVALYYALGIAYFERQAWPEAIQSLEVALAQAGAPTPDNAPWRGLGITTADILGPMGVAYLELGQCETGAAIVERAYAESNSPAAWEWALKRIETCYRALTPTPTATP